MPYVMNYETWKNKTSVSRKPRSSQLRAVDSALKQYHKVRTEAALKELRLALHHWKMFKGYDADGGKPGWLTSERNRHGAVQALDLQLFDVKTPLEKSVLADLADLPFYGVEAWAEEDARSALADARRQALPLLFQGKRVQVKRMALIKIGQEINRGIKKTRKKADAAAAAATAGAKEAATAPAREAAREAMAPARKIAEQVLEEVLAVFPDVATELTSLMAEIVPTFLMDLAASVAPYASLAPGSYKAVKNTLAACKDEYKWIRMHDHMPAFGSGDPTAAAEAMLRIIERYRNQHARLGAIYANDVAVKAVAIGCDAATLGIPSVSAIVTPMQGCVTAIANLTLKLMLLARDIYEVKQANKILSGNCEITADLFQKNPLMGAYFVACATHSDILNFLIEDIGAPGWQLDVEVLMDKHIHPMVGTARDMINSSRYEVDGLQMSKGVVADVSPGMKNIKNRLKKQAVTRIKAQIPFIEKPAV